MRWMDVRTDESQKVGLENKLSSQVRKILKSGHQRFRIAQLNVSSVLFSLFQRFPCRLSSPLRLIVLLKRILLSHNGLALNNPQAPDPKTDIQRNSVMKSKDVETS